RAGGEAVRETGGDDGVLRDVVVGGRGGGDAVGVRDVRRGEVDPVVVEALHHVVLEAVAAGVVEHEGADLRGDSGVVDVDAVGAYGDQVVLHGAGHRVDRHVLQRVVREGAR